MEKPVIRCRLEVTHRFDVVRNDAHEPVGNEALDVGLISRKFGPVDDLEAGRFGGPIEMGKDPADRIADFLSRHAKP